MDLNYVGCDVQVDGCIPEVEVAKRVGRRLDWVPAEAESPALVRTDAEVEKRLLVRFAPFTALRERRVMPREVSIVLVGDDSKRQRQQLRRKGVGYYGKEFGNVRVLLIQAPNQLRRCSDHVENDIAVIACVPICCDNIASLNIVIGYCVPCVHNTGMYLARMLSTPMTSSSRGHGMVSVSSECQVSAKCLSQRQLAESTYSQLNS